MYIETNSPRVAGDNAKLEFSVPGNGGLSCLEFYYHMYGSTMGTLTVFNGNVVVFNASGNHGNYWREANVNIYLNHNVSFKVSSLLERITPWLSATKNFLRPRNEQNSTKQTTPNNLIVIIFELLLSKIRFPLDMFVSNAETKQCNSFCY